MRKAITLGLVAVVLGVVSAPAAADVITQTELFSGTPDFVVPLTFDRFDPSMGTLLSVEIEMILNIDGGYLLVDNDGVDPAVVHAELGSSGNLSSVDVSLTNVLGQPIASNLVTFQDDDFSLAGEDGDGPNNQNNGPDEATLTGGAYSNSDSGFIHAAFMGNYIGITTFDILADINQYFSHSGGSGVEGAFGPVFADGQVTVTYNWIVPEPSTLSLLGFGALALIRRRS